MCEVMVKAKKKKSKHCKCWTKEFLLYSRVLKESLKVTR
jgi:hypothetical protein